MKTAESILKYVIPSLLKNAEKHTRLMNKEKGTKLYLKALNKLSTKIKIQLTADVLTLACKNNKAATPNSICNFSEYDFYLNF